MRQEIEEIYGALLRTRAEDPRYPGYAGIVGLIQRLGEDYPLRIRADAVFVLANTLSDLVLAPLVIARRDGSDGDAIPDDLILRFCEADIRTVLGRAVEAALSRDRKEISSTSCIIALGQSIETLALNNLHLWGRGD